MSGLTNMGTVDRAVRAVIGIFLVAAPYLFDAALWNNAAIRWAIPLVGLVLVVTALFGFCPAYRVLGINNDNNDKH